MNTNKWPKSKRNGFALALVLSLIILLLIIGVGVLSLGTHQRMLGVRTSSEIAARSAADAGLTKAMFSMNKMLEAKTWHENSLPNVKNERIPNSDLSYSYNVVKLPKEDKEDDDIYVIKCVGKSGLVQKTVSCTFELKGLFEYAIFTLGDLMLRNGTTVSAYNQDADDPPLQVGTNSTESGAITAKLGVTIEGDIVVGPDGNPEDVIDSAHEATITGSVYPSLVTNKTPKINVPKALQELPSSGSITNSATINNMIKYDSIDLAGSGVGNKLVVNGETIIYVTGDIRLGNNDQIIIVDASVNPDASLIIYLEGNIIVDNGGGINNLTKDASKLKLYGLETCTNIEFKNSGDFYGAIYAPDADIHLYNSVQVYGAVVGKSFTQDVNANFYYDMSLRQVDASEIGVYMELKRWSE